MSELRERIARILEWCDVDDPDGAEDESVGWESVDGEGRDIPLTFGDVRWLKRTLSALLDSGERPEPVAWAWYTDDDERWRFNSEGKKPEPHEHPTNKHLVPLYSDARTRNSEPGVPASDIEARLWDATFVTNDPDVRTVLHDAIAEVKTLRVRAPESEREAISDAIETAFINGYVSAMKRETVMPVFDAAFMQRAGVAFEAWCEVDEEGNCRLPTESRAGEERPKSYPPNAWHSFPDDFDPGGTDD